MADLMLRTEQDRARLIGYLTGLDLAKPRRLTIVEVRNKRSDAQNRLLWMWNGLIQAHLRDSHGQLGQRRRVARDPRGQALAGRGPPG